MDSILAKYSFHDSWFLGMNLHSNKEHMDDCYIMVEDDKFLEPFHSKIIRIYFIEVYKIKCNIQAWINGRDSIRGITEEKGLDLDNPVSNHFHLYKIVLNTSNSEIIVLAKGIKIETF